MAKFEFPLFGSILLVDDVQMENMGNCMVLVTDKTGVTVSNPVQVTLKKSLMTGIERAVKGYFPLLRRNPIRCCLAGKMVC